VKALDNMPGENILAVYEAAKSWGYEGVLPGNDGLPGDYRQGETVFALYDMRCDRGER